MPITNLAIQRRRLLELQHLIRDPELGLFNIELGRTYYYGPMAGMNPALADFIIYARSLTPTIVKTLEVNGFKIQHVKAINDDTLRLELYKAPTKEEKPARHIS